jgi:hypothetical protein
MWLAFFQWCEDSTLATAILDAGWVMPLCNVVHEIGMALVLGGVLLMNLRMFGVVMTHRPVGEIASEIRPWIIGGLLIMLVTGSGMFLPEAARWYRSVPFRAKMTLFVAALVFQFTLHRNLAARETADPRTYRIAAAVSLLLWFGVGLGGRAITFLGE